MKSNKFDWSQRLQSLPPYLFAQIDKEKKKLKERKVSFYDVSIGDPDILAPKGVSQALYKSSLKKENQKYALDQGKPLLCRTIKDWFKKRFLVTLDESNEILPLIGSKEGLVHFPLGFVNKGDYVIIPSPGYPGYRSAALFAGARVYELPLFERNGFLPNLDKIPASVRNKAKIIYLNYPNNPTTALASYDSLRDLVAFCSKYGIIIAYDNAYSEIYFDDKPLSILEIKGAKEIAIEFHSLSKTFCMTGYRVGWACGNPHFVKTLLKVKTNVDSGIFGSVQDAAIYALKNESKYVQQLRKTMRERRDLFVQGLKRKGFNKVYANSTFYVWAKLPRPHTSSIDFAKHLLQKKVVATPGLGFGKWGEGFVRFAMTVDKKLLKKVIEII